MTHTLFTDGVYRSYWISKFNNAFIKRGKKKKINKHLNKCLVSIKFNTHASPIIFVFEIVDRVKPTFKLENSFPGKTPVIYPKVVDSAKQYSIAIRWIQLYILENRSNAGRNTVGFYKHLISSLNQLATSKSNLLIKKRDRYHQEAVALQENARYTWSKL